MDDFIFELPDYKPIGNLNEFMAKIHKESGEAYTKVSSEVWAKLALIFPINRLGMKYDGNGGEEILLILDDLSMIKVAEIVYDRSVSTEIKIIGRYNMENIEKYQTYFLDKLLRDDSQ